VIDEVLICCVVPLGLAVVTNKREMDQSRDDRGPNFAAPDIIEAEVSVSIDNSEQQRNEQPRRVGVTYC